MSKLKTIKSRHIKEVRGEGSSSASSFIRRPAEPGGSAKRSRTPGLLCKETHDNVIRFAPPLIIKKWDLDWAFERIEGVFDA